jgi:hypothetical protein
MLNFARLQLVCKPWPFADTGALLGLCNIVFVIEKLHNHGVGQHRD